MAETKKRARRSRRCPSCRKLRRPAEFIDSDPPSRDSRLCVWCLRRRHFRLLTDIVMMQPDQNPFGPAPTKSLDELGYREEHRNFWICGDCLGLYQRDVAPAQAQLCTCRAERTPQERWDRFDYNERIQLCECCASHVLGSGSKWSVWFCEPCKELVLDYNRRCVEAVIPIGRHSMMNGVGLSFDELPSAKRVNLFHDELMGLFGRMDVLHDHGKAQLKRSLCMADLPAGRDVQLVRYLEAAARWEMANSGAFGHLVDHFDSIRV